MKRTTYSVEFNFRAKRDKIAGQIKMHEYQGNDVNHIDKAA